MLEKAEYCDAGSMTYASSISVSKSSGILS
jgi:hypothetical protein